MNSKNILKDAINYAKSHKIELLLIIIAACIGAYVSYHLWRIDFW